MPTSLHDVKEKFKRKINAAQGFDVMFFSLETGFAIHRKKQVNASGLRTLISEIETRGDDMRVAELNMKLSIVCKAQANARAEVQFNGVKVDGRRKLKGLRSH